MDICCMRYAFTIAKYMYHNTRIYLKKFENEHQNIICGNIIDYFRTIYTFSHRLCEKKNSHQIYYRKTLVY